MPNGTAVPCSESILQVVFWIPFIKTGTCRNRAPRSRLEASADLMRDPGENET